MSKRARMFPAVRREAIVTAALDLASRYGYRNVTRAQVAQAAGCSPSLVSHYLGVWSPARLRRFLMRAAVERCVLEVVAQGLVLRDEEACAAPDSLKAAAIQHIKDASETPANGDNP